MVDRKYRRRSLSPSRLKTTYNTLILMVSPEWDTENMEILFDWLTCAWRCDITEYNSWTVRLLQYYTCKTKNFMLHKFALSHACHKTNYTIFSKKNEKNICREKCRRSLDVCSTVIRALLGEFKTSSSALRRSLFLKFSPKTAPTPESYSKYYNKKNSQKKSEHDWIIRTRAS